MLTCLPLFLNEVLRFDMTKIGFVASIPYLASLVAMNLAGIIVDYMIKRKCMKAIHIRKLVTMTSFGVQAVCLVGAGYCQCGQVRYILVILVISYSIDEAG